MEAERKTITLDATDKVPGRLASHIAKILMGKHKASYQPHIDMGDIVQVENVAKMKITAKRAEQKVYKRHTMYPGGLRQRTLREVWEKDPSIVLWSAVKNMLPKNKLQAGRLKRLNIK